MKKIFLVILLNFFWYLSSFAADVVNISAYYPSPFGSYSELRSNQLAVGSGYRSSTISDGTLIVQSKIGVATNNPQYEMDVNGNIAVSDIWIRSKNRWLSTADIFVY
jgi:hypothetical protein